MQINQLRNVLAVARCGTFTKAAQELFITQSALSQQIHALEEEIGTAIFYRHARSISLTPAGEKFVEYAERVINDTELTLSEMKDFADMKRGSLTLGCLWIFSYLDMVQSVQEFIEDFPHIDIMVKLDGSKNILKQLRQREIDAGILIGLEDLTGDPGIHTKLLHHDHYVMLVNKNNPLSRKPVLTAEDLDGQFLIMPELNSTAYEEMNTIIQAAQVHPRIVCESSHNGVNATMVEHNLAMSFSSTSVAKALNRDGLFVEVPFEPVVPRQIYLAALDYRMSDPLIQTLFEYFGEDPETP